MCPDRLSGRSTSARRHRLDLMRRVVILLLATALLAPAATVAARPMAGAARYSAAHPLPGAPACPIFPADNPWNQRVDGLPVARRSAAMIAQIGLNDAAECVSIVCQPLHKRPDAWAGCEATGMAKCVVG